MELTEPSRPRRWWKEEEDDVLRREAQIQLNDGELKDWNRIAKLLPGRTNKDCRKRWSKVSNLVNKGMWTADEDRRLESAVILHGSKWTHVAIEVGTRHADQCAKRWRHSLNPDLDRGEWTPEDDKALLNAVSATGRNWKAIGEKRFPRRSTTDIKNRYVILERRRRHTMSGDMPSTKRTSPSVPASAHFAGFSQTIRSRAYMRAESCVLPDTTLSQSPPGGDSFDLDAYSETFVNDPDTNPDAGFLNSMPTDVPFHTISTDPMQLGFWVWPPHDGTSTVSEPTPPHEDMPSIPYTMGPADYSVGRPLPNLGSSALIPSSQPGMPADPRTLRLSPQPGTLASITSSIPPSPPPDAASMMLGASDPLSHWSTGLMLDEPAMPLPETCSAGFSGMTALNSGPVHFQDWTAGAGGGRKRRRIRGDTVFRAGWGH